MFPFSNDTKKHVYALHYAAFETQNVDDGFFDVTFVVEGKVSYIFSIYINVCNFLFIDYPRS